VLPDGNLDGLTRLRKIQHRLYVLASFAGRAEGTLGVINSRRAETAFPRGQDGTALLVVDSSGGR